MQVLLPWAQKAVVVTSSQDSDTWSLTLKHPEEPCYADAHVLLTRPLAEGAGVTGRCLTGSLSHWHRAPCWLREVEQESKAL